MTISARFVCCKCGEEKPEEDFGIRRNNKTGRDSACKVCVAANNSKTKAKLREVHYKELENYACCACGFNHSNAKEVHHLASSYKRFGRSQDIKYNLEDVDNGLAIVLCSNCHSIFHGVHGGKVKPFPLYSKEETVTLIQNARSIS